MADVYTTREISNWGEGSVEPPIPDDDFVYARVLHDYEIWVTQFDVFGHGQYLHDSWEWRVGLPEVFWLFDGTNAELGEEWQYMMRDMNSTMSNKKLRILWDAVRAFSNGFGKGFDTTHDENSSSYVPVQDFFNNKDIKPNVPNLQKDKIRLCGGATVRGKIVGEWFYPETLDVTNPPPKWNDLKDKWWLYFRAVSSGKNKVTKTPQISDFPQGDGLPVLIPFVSRTVVKIPLGALEIVEGKADPYRIYITPSLLVKFMQSVGAITRPIMRGTNRVLKPIRNLMEK